MTTPLPPPPRGPRPLSPPFVAPPAGWPGSGAARGDGSGGPPAQGGAASRSPAGAGTGTAAADWRRFSLLNDEPVGNGLEDVLGAQQTAARLSALLQSSHRSTPFTLAIDAGWGMGKSSLMRLVDSHLSDQRNTRTVWYNAWTAGSGDALEGLIKSVLISLDPNVLRRGLRRLSDHGPLLNALRALLTVGAGVLHAAGPINELWDRMSVDPRARNQMRDVLRELVGDWSRAAPRSSGGRMLVVFIDDLDRCSEETVLAVCEALKLYLDVPGLAFVIGCDRSALAPNGLLRDLTPAAAAFLEKIFQTSYRVPIADDTAITEYVTRCAQTAGIGPFLDGDLTRLLIERSGRNPRRIKRLVNGFVLEASLNPIWRGFGSEAVVRVLLLQYFYGDFYRMMTTPRAAAERDVVAEFRDYRRVRRLFGELGAGAAPASDIDSTFVTELWRAYELPAPFREAPNEESLRHLERELPVDFPALAADRGFTSLIEELMALDEADVLVGRLRHAPPMLPVPDPVLVAPEQQGPYGAPADPSYDTGGYGYGSGYERGDGTGYGYESGDGTGSYATDATPAGPPSSPYRYTPYDPAQQPGDGALPPPYPTGPPASSGRNGGGQDGPGRQTPRPVPPQGSAQPGRAYPAGSPQQQALSRPDGNPGRPEYPRPAAAYPELSRNPSSPAGFVGSAAAFVGFRVLWCDGQPATVTRMAQELIQEGAEVRVVGTVAEADEVIAADWPDLLICDIARGDDRNPGFAYVERLRQTGAYERPVVFFTPTVTPARVESAREVGALGIAVDLPQLLPHITSVYLMTLNRPPQIRPPRNPSAAPSAPPSPASDGRPR